MEIKKEVVDAIIAQGAKELPNECCGYLASKDGVVIAHYELYNTDQSPEHYSMDPKEQFNTVRAIRDAGYQVAAVYHSHPETPARPSIEDIALAYDPTISYVIISFAEETPYAKSFKIASEKVTPEEFTII